MKVCFLLLLVSLSLCVFVYVSLEFFIMINISIIVCIMCCIRSLIYKLEIFVCTVLNFVVYW